MKRSFHKTYIVFAAVLLTIIASVGCKSLLQKSMPNGLDFKTLKVEDAKVIKTFETAKANNKNVLLIFDATWCGSCRKLNQKTMKDSEVRKTLEKDFEFLNIDVDKYPEVTNAFKNEKTGKGIEAIPAVLIFSSEGIQTDEIVGYYNPEKFNRVLKRNL